MEFISNLLDSFILSIWAGIVGGWIVSKKLMSKSFLEGFTNTLETFFLGIAGFFGYLMWVHPELRGELEFAVFGIFLMIFLFIRFLRLLFKL